jgi:hypothetical protein
MAGLDIEKTFTIDAAKLLAKLHRGACETHKDMMFFNSGVIDDQTNLAPDAVEKSKISFDTSMTQCEIGVVAQPEIECKLKYSADDILDKMTETKKENDEKSKITENPDDKKVNESDIPSFMSFIREDDKDDKKEDKKENNDDVLVDPLNEPKDASDEVKKMVKENQDEFTKTLDNALKNSLQYLKDYMLVFAGKDEAGKINDKSIAKVYLPDDSDPSKFKYKDGVIEGTSEDERRKVWLEELKKKSDTKVYIIRNLCCKIQYTLNMEL